MAAVTLQQVEEQIRKLPADKLAEVAAFVATLTDLRSPKSTPHTDNTCDIVVDDDRAAEEGMDDYLAQLEDYEDRLARGEMRTILDPLE